MKKNSLLIIAILAAASVFGQQSPKSQEPFTNPSDSANDRPRLLLRNWQPGKTPVQASFSHNTSRGKVYILTPDNMPCLVPDMKRVAPMPTRVMPSMPNSIMPNLIPRQKINPKEEPANR